MHCLRHRPLRVSVCQFSAPCAHLLGESRNFTEDSRDSMMIEVYGGAEGSLPFLRDVPSARARNFCNQTAYV